MIVEQAANALAGGEDPQRFPFTSSECPTHTPTSSPLARKRPPPDRPCSGIFSVIKNGRAPPLSLSSNVTVSTNREFQRVSLRPRSIPIEVTTESGRRFFVGMGEPSDIRQSGHFLDADDRQVGGGVGGREGGRDHARPNAWRCRHSLHAEIVAVQLDEDRSFAFTDMRGRQDQGLAVDRGDDRAAPLRRSAADHDGRAGKSVVPGHRRPAQALASAGLRTAVARRATGLGPGGRLGASGRTRVRHQARPATHLPRVSRQSRWHVASWMIRATHRSRLPGCTRDAVSRRSKHLANVQAARPFAWQTIELGGGAEHSCDPYARVERMVNRTKDSCMRLPEMIQFGVGIIGFAFSRHRIAAAKQKRQVNLRGIIMVSVTNGGR